MADDDMHDGVVTDDGGAESEAAEHLEHSSVGSANSSLELLDGENENSEFRIQSSCLVL